MTKTSGKTESKKIGGFQVTTVTEVPEAARKARGIYADLLGAVPAPPNALCIDFDEAKKASGRVAGLRGYLRRNKLTEQFTVVRQAAKVFVSKVAEKKDTAAADQPQE